MPPLSNPKHERFAQELAKGATAEKAYEAAGYKPARQNAHRLITNDDIAFRVRELQERAAIKTELTVASITDRLLKIADAGEGLKEAPGLSVARAALMDAAKLNGLIVDRSENVNINHVVSGDLPTEDQWAEEHATEH